uniref:Uncharacterized protein n=1 Tax=Lepeophtheirus salmonis TaxID=72036 RepID=A0A0K2V1C1_LEPSM
MSNLTTSMKSQRKYGMDGNCQETYYFSPIVLWFIVIGVIHIHICESGLDSLPSLLRKDVTHH